MKLKILLTKETRAGERRVALVPEDVRILVEQGCSVFIEHNAGLAAEFTDQAYEKAGAKIRHLNAENVQGYQELFRGIKIIARAKRPDRAREILESQAMKPGTIMVGAFDPLEKHSSHIDEYHQAKVKAYSIDQLELPADHPMNLLSAMSQIAGKLAFLDALRQYKHTAQKVVIIGFGAMGQAAFAEAMAHHLAVTVVVSNPQVLKEIEQQGAKAFLLDKTLDPASSQNLVKNIVADADIVVTGARRANQVAPLLIPLSTLQSMKKGSIVVDMALSEGGNVEGSHHDASLVLGNEVIVTNVSGYPKAVPHDASILWSRATRHFIQSLVKGDTAGLQPC